MKSVLLALVIILTVANVQARAISDTEKKLRAEYSKTIKELRSLYNKKKAMGNNPSPRLDNKFEAAKKRRLQLIKQIKAEIAKSKAAESAEKKEKLAESADGAETQAKEQVAEVAATPASTDENAPAPAEKVDDPELSELRTNVVNANKLGELLKGQLNAYKNYLVKCERDYLSPNLYMYRGKRTFTISKATFKDYREVSFYIDNFNRNCNFISADLSQINLALDSAKNLVRAAGVKAGKKSKYKDDLTKELAENEKIVEELSDMQSDLYKKLQDVQQYSKKTKGRKFLK